MLKKDFINKICSRIKYTQMNEEIANELDSHIEDLKEELLKTEIDHNQIEQKAINQMGNIEDIANQFNKVYCPKYDWILNALTFLLLLFGIIISFSLNKLQIIENLNFKILSIPIGIVLGILLILFNYKKLEKYSLLLFFVTFIITILSCFFKTISEFYTLILALYVISYSGILRKFKFSKKTFIVALISLISTILLSKICLLILFIAFITITIFQKDIKLNKKIFSTSFIIISIMMCLLVLLSSSFSKLNLAAYTNPENYNTTEGYIYIQKNKILSNAQLMGNSKSEIQNYIGKIQDDNIFTYIISNYGILPSLLIIMSFSLLIYRLIINFTNLKDMYGKNIFVGCSTILILQIMLNLFNGLNIIPYISIDLPFITINFYNSISTILVISLCISIYRRKNIIKIDNNEKTTASKNLPNSSLFFHKTIV